MSSKQVQTRQALRILVSIEPGFLSLLIRLMKWLRIREEEEQRILNTNEPAPLQESDSDSDDVPSISHLRALKTHVSFVFKIPMSILRRASNWRHYYIAKSGTLGVQRVWL